MKTTRDGQYDARDGGGTHLLDLDVLDVCALEHDVIVDLRAGRDLRANLLATLGAVGLDVLDRQRGINIVNVVKDALVPDLALGDQADLGPDVLLRLGHVRGVARGDYERRPKEGACKNPSFFRTRF